MFLSQKSQEVKSLKPRNSAYIYTYRHIYIYRLLFHFQQQFTNIPSKQQHIIYFDSSKIRKQKLLILKKKTIDLYQMLLNKSRHCTTWDILSMSSKQMEQDSTSPWLECGISFRNQDLNLVFHNIWVDVHMATLRSPGQKVKQWGPHVKSRDQLKGAFRE